MTKKSASRFELIVGGITIIALLLSLFLISAKNNIGIMGLKEELTQLANIGVISNNQTIVSNSPHFNALSSIKEVQKGIDNQISSDLFAIDIREALHHLCLISG